ncbi:unnamed protein product [Brachionus calyciflorus]|uniref:Endonuclease/exonuclease/phosphatase domain-containing protein n=1 Tax=Brachionus calyciflorus TaxID=104777 RepID=A0A814A920_9BILA|nr:unnamed protein product [Brachionus calyciflorus]
MELFISFVSKLDNKNFRKAKKDKSTGRPSGGLAFIIDKNIESKYIDLSDRINILIINKLAIINVYLTYYDGSIENKFDFSSEITQLNETLDDLKRQDFEIIVLGDFNADPIKTNHNSNEFLNFICKNELCMVDTASSQYVDYTFKNLKRGISSWIDHILVEKSNQKIGKCHILVSAENKSDHNPLSTTYRLDNRLAKVNKQPKRFLNLEWNNLRAILKFQERVNDGINKLDSLKCELENESDKTKLKIMTTRMLNEISSVLLNSVRKTMNELDCLKKKKKRKIGELKFKSWWDKNIQELYNNVVKNSGLRSNNTKDPTRKLTLKLRFSKVSMKNYSITETTLPM